MSQCALHLPISTSRGRDPWMLWRGGRRRNWIWRRWWNVRALWVELASAMKSEMERFITIVASSFEHIIIYGNYMRWNCSPFLLISYWCTVCRVVSRCALQTLLFTLTGPKNPISPHARVPPLLRELKFKHRSSDRPFPLQHSTCLTFDSYTLLRPSR